MKGKEIKKTFQRFFSCLPTTIEMPAYKATVIENTFIIKVLSKTVKPKTTSTKALET